MNAETIEEYVTPVKKWNPKRDAPDKRFTYIDIAGVSQSLKEVTGENLVEGSQAPSRARQLVSHGDILVSTVRPNLNAVAMVPEHLDGATASTGFCVLRPVKSKLNGRYLYHWVKSPEFVKSMVKQATGQSYPAVSDKIVKASSIPLPELEEQTRIAAILDKADELRRLRQVSIAKLNTLSHAIFHEMFVKEASEAWPEVQIGDLVENARTGPFGSQLLHSEFVEEGIAVLGIDNVVSNEFVWAKPRFITPEKYEQLKRYTVRPGYVLITIMGTCGRCAIVPHDIPVAINTKHICCLTPKNKMARPEFLKSAFLMHPTVLKQLGIEAKGAVMPGLNMGIIKSLKVPLPPIVAQAKFAKRLKAIQNALTAEDRARNKNEILFSSLQQRGFKGEL